MAGRRSDHNMGAFLDRAIPADKYIVAGVIVMKDDDGKFAVYASNNHVKMPDWQTSPMPDPEVLEALTGFVLQAWQAASLPTTN